MGLEEATETKWIFRYLRADRVWVDMGFYDAEGEAKEKRDDYSSFGATCSEPEEVSVDYELQNQD